jgi:hypothetical protein
MIVITFRMMDLSHVQILVLINSPKKSCFPIAIALPRLATPITGPDLTTKAGEELSIYVCTQRADLAGPGESHTQAGF